MKVSVIIPVYNKVKDVEACLESIFTQDFDDFEVIAVNDGSSDGSGDVCDRIAKEHPNLKVIHAVNEGVTAARRKGVEAAQGKYITFADADDKLMPGALKALYDTIVRENADEVVGTYVTQYGEHITNGITGQVDSMWMLGEIMATRNRFCILWGVMFRKELLDGCLNTPRLIRDGEDILMQILCLIKNPKVVFISDCVYYYIKGPANTKQKLEEQEMYDDILHKAMAPQWDKYKDLFTLRQLKMYETFISQKKFHVFKYYREARKRLSKNIPLADRIAILLPPRLAYFPIIIKKKWLN